MRRRRRQIEIFSISALDLFASALGAFILVAIILFPYYLKDQGTENRIAIADKANRDLHGELERANAKMATLQNEAAAARRAAGTPFLTVIISWTVPGADVDLHVVDPAGREFDWAKPNANRRDYPGSAGALAFDMTNGPATELWQNPEAEPGEYKVDYVANVLPEGVTVEVEGVVYDRAGRHALPVRILRRARERARAASIQVAADGHVAFR